MINFSARFIPFYTACLVFLSSLIGTFYWNSLLVLAFISGALVIVGLVDLNQKQKALRRNYPITAHFRYLFESIRPEIRQYFLENNDEAQPFSRNQRSLVYQRAKQETDKRAFGTQLDVYSPDYEWINHSMAPCKISSSDFRILIGCGADGGCTQPYSASIFNISAMSFGSLSANAILALNKGAKEGNFMHDTGEGGISSHHRENGGDLVWEIGSGYFGCRNSDGSFSEERFIDNARSAQVKMIELKLSQGAKPGIGGILPGAKVTDEISAARGVPVGQDCISPSYHSAFSTPIELLEFIAKLRRLSGGKPTGFKLAIGHPWEFFAIVKAMLQTHIVPDFIVIDGSEGGTGSAPVEFADHVGTPMQEALVLVHNALVGSGLRSKIKIGASGKIISAFDIARTLAMGADWCNSARGFMFALGCIQSLSCHTDHCPTGVATQDKTRQKALVVSDKSSRVANFHKNTMKALADLLGASGLTHPSELRPHHLVRRISKNQVKQTSLLVPFLDKGQLLDNKQWSRLPPVFAEYWPVAQAHTFDPLDNSHPTQA